jgi:hypothetical protein
MVIFTPDTVALEMSVVRRKYDVARMGMNMRAEICGN